MKNIVVYDEYNEVDFKPLELVEEYIRLTQEDIEKFLLKQGGFKEVSCPGCQGGAVQNRFEKFGLTYKECGHCRSLYVSPRPDEKTLADYYSNARSRIFWRDKISQATNRKRKEKIIKPRLEWIVESTQEYFPQAKHYVDINTNQFGYVEELDKIKHFVRKSIVSPLMSLDEVRAVKGAEIIASSWQDVVLQEYAGVVSGFEILNRVADLDVFLNKISRMLLPGGLCFLTVILGSGFDMQVLWDRSGHILPPDRLNLLSVEGMQALISRHPFECLEFSTPGILDVEIVSKAYAEDPSLPLPRFVRYLIEHKSVEARSAFQEFLQQNLLSSYGRILLRKGEK